MRESLVTLLSFSMKKYDFVLMFFSNFVGVTIVKKFIKYLLQQVNRSKTFLNFYLCDGELSFLMVYQVKLEDTLCHHIVVNE